jgi:DNA-binding NtrC family response regulator
VNVRVIAGAKRDLRQLVTEGKFREDLYYRLNVLPVALPPLRERREDIPLLTDHFLRRYFRRNGLAEPPVSDAVRQVFMQYEWPGNVRELENACERIAQTCVCGTARVGCIAASILMGASGTPAPSAAPPSAVEAPSPAAPPKNAEPVALDEHLRALESSLISWALNASRGNKSKAAELLQIKRSTLGDRIKRCGLGNLDRDAATARPAAAEAGEPVAEPV